MNKRSLVVIVLSSVILLAVVGYVIFRQSTDEVGEVTSAGVEATSQPTTPETDLDSADPPGLYVAYTDQDFSQRSDKRRLLFFHAQWCPQCRALDASIASEMTLPEDVVIYKVDYDDRQDLRQKYGVTIQTTVVLVDENGDKTDSYVAYDTPDFASVERALLK